MTHTYIYIIATSMSTTDIGIFYNLLNHCIKLEALECPRKNTLESENAYNIYRSKKIESDPVLSRCCDLLQEEAKGRECIEIAAIRCNLPIMSVEA